MKSVSLALLALVVSTACGARSVRVEPVMVRPIHITVDVNLYDQPAEPPKR